MPYAAATAIAGTIFTVGTTAFYVAVAVLTAVFTLAANYLMQELFGRKPPATDLSMRDNILTIRQATAAWEYVYGRVRKGGTYAFMHTTNNNHFLHMVIVVADHEVAAITDIYFDDELVEFDAGGAAIGKYAGHARCVKMLGSPNQVALQELIDAAPDKWTTDHRLRGHAYLYVRLKYNINLFTQVPNISCVIDGKRVYDPRDEAQDPEDPATWEYSTNPANCLADYIQDTDIGLDGRGEVLEAYWIAAANACDEEVPLIEGGTEPRYSCNGVVACDLAHGDLLRAMMTSMDGELVAPGSRWRINAGVWREPEVALDESDLRGAVMTRTRRPRRELYNGVRGVFNSPENQYVAADFPAVISDSFVALDGAENFFDISLPFTKSASMAQRIAKILLLKSRQQILTTWPCKLTAFAAQAGDNVLLSRAALGWEEKPFKVSSFQLTSEEGDDETTLLGVDLTLEETHHTIYDWSLSEEQVIDPAPDTNLPDPFTIAPPGNVEVTSGGDLLRIDGAGQVISQMRVTIDPPVDAFVYQYQIEWRRDTEALWTDARISARADQAAEFIISPVVDGATYHTRVKSIGRFRGESGYFTPAPHVVIGKASKPSAADDFYVERKSNGTRRFSWTHENVEADVRVGGGYKISYYLGSSGDIAAFSPLHTGLIKSSPYETGDLAAGNYTFALQTVDSSGNVSAAARFITARLGNPPLEGALYTASERVAGWPGTKTDCFVNSNGRLVAKADGDWTDLPATWAALDGETWETMLGKIGTIAYESEVIDLGSDLIANPLVTAAVTGDQTITIKTGLTADGAVAGGWVPPESKLMRYVQIRVEVTGAQPAIDQLDILLDGKGAIDRFNDVNTATTSAAWFDRIAAGHFKIAVREPIAAITAINSFAFQNVGPGWTWEIISKSADISGTPAAEIKMYDATGTLADATIDLTLEGPALP